MIVEQRDGVVKPIAFESINAAKYLADKCGGKVTALYLGAEGEIETKAMIHQGADKILILTNPHLAHFNTATYADVLLPLIRSAKPFLLLLSATHYGKELAPTLASSLGSGQVTDCVSLELDGDFGLQVRRPVYLGKAQATLAFNGSSTPVVTLRPNVFRNSKRDSSRTGQIEKREVDLSENSLKVKIREVVTNTGETIDIREARIVVAGGLGMQGPENFKLLEDLAEVLGGAVAVSLPVVVNEWRHHSCQVGESGRTVSPDLYIACGISGAAQHLAGMSTSKCIVAINIDPYAPIFSVAHIGVEGDVFEVLPLLTEEFKNALNEGTL
ncbi:MAG: electron transfer flavoprotein subunit alpha/FixB family protein [Nitrospinales bacterium]